MNIQLLKTFVIASIIVFAGCDKADKTAPQEKAAMPAETSTAPAPMAEEAAATAVPEKPSMSETSVSTMEATVTAIDQATRAVTLQDAEGNSVSFVADDDVKNLAQVEVGDILTVEYLEGVTVEVVDPTTELGVEVVEEAGKAAAGEKPGAAAASEMTLVVVIEAIDKENEQVTLKGPQGNSKIVQVRNPENLEKVAVGDKVMITYTEAIAISVTEKEK